MNSTSGAEGGGKVTATSAGIWAEDGLEISARAARFLESKGVDASGFRSRKFYDGMCDENQLTITMNMGIKGMLLFRKPEAVIYTLSEYSLMGADISKMEGMEEKAYAETMEELDEMVKRAYKRATRNVTF